MTYFYSVYFEIKDFYETYAVLILTPRQLQVHSKRNDKPLFSALLDCCDVSLFQGGLLLNNYAQECILQVADAPALCKAIKSKSLPPRQKLQFTIGLRTFEMQVEERDVVFTGAQSYYQRVDLRDITYCVRQNTIVLTYQRKQREMLFRDSIEAQNAADLLYIAQHCSQYRINLDLQQSKLRKTQFLQTLRAQQQESRELDEQFIDSGPFLQPQRPKTLREIELASRQFTEPDDQALPPKPKEKPFSIPFVKRMQESQQKAALAQGGAETSHFSVASQQDDVQRAQHQELVNNDVRQASIAADAEVIEDFYPEVEFIEPIRERSALAHDSPAAGQNAAESYDPATLYQVSRNEPLVALSHAPDESNAYEKAVARARQHADQASQMDFADKAVSVSALREINQFDAQRNEYAAKEAAQDAACVQDGYNYNLQAALTTLEGDFYAFVGKQQLRLAFKLVGSTIIVQFARHCQVTRTIKLSALEELKRNTQYVWFCMRDPHGNYANMIMRCDQYELMAPALRTALDWARQFGSYM